MKPKTKTVFILTVILTAITAMFCFPGNPDVIFFKAGGYNWGINYSSYWQLKLSASAMWVITMVIAYTEK